MQSQKISFELFLMKGIDCICKYELSKCKVNFPFLIILFLARHFPTQI